MRSVRVAGAVHDRGRVVAVSAAQHGTAKRGVAAGIARALVGIDAGRVCVLDADPQSREVGWRFGIAEPTAQNVAGALLANPIADPFGLVPRDERSGCWVVPLGPDGAPVERSAYEVLVRRLRDHLDYLVIDAPVAYPLRARRIDSLVDDVDELVVATDTEHTTFSTLLRYLNALMRGCISGDLPVDLRVRVLPTGEKASDEAALWSSRAPRNVVFTPVVPHLWGREAMHDAAAGVVPEELFDIVRDITRDACRESV